MLEPIRKLHGGSPALNALTAEDEEILLRIVRPDNAPPSHPFKDYVDQIGTNPLVFQLRSDSFLWIENLLNIEDRNREKLRCYHNTTFESLNRAGNMQRLLESAAQQPPQPVLEPLVRSALSALTDPSYTNFNLRAFIERKRCEEDRQRGPAAVK